MRFLVTIAVLIFTQLATAKISELKSYKNFDLKQDFSETWVVFDIDNTLLRQDSMIGTHQWGDSIREHYKSLGTAAVSATVDQHAAFAKLQDHVSVVPTEKEVYRVLKFLQKNSIPHFAFTARGANLKAKTLEQIASLKFHFNDTFPKLNDLKKFEKHYENGVIFAGDVTKGELLKRLVDGATIKPKHIIFIDDRLYNLESIEKELAQHPIKLTSLRYGGVDHVVNKFDHKLALLLYSFFLESGVLYPDSKIKKIQNNPLEITKLRNKNYLEKTKTNANIKTCSEISELEYSCRMQQNKFDRSAIMQNYRYEKDPINSYLYFGPW